MFTCVSFLSLARMLPTDLVSSRVPFCLHWALTRGPEVDYEILVTSGDMKYYRYYCAIQDVFSLSRDSNKKTIYRRFLVSNSNKKTLTMTLSVSPATETYPGPVLTQLISFNQKVKSCIIWSDARTAHKRTRPTNSVCNWDSEFANRSRFILGLCMVAQLANINW